MHLENMETRESLERGVFQVSRLGAVVSGDVVQHGSHMRDGREGPRHMAQPKSENRKFRNCRGLNKMFQRVTSISAADRETNSVL